MKIYRKTHAVFTKFERHIYKHEQGLRELDYHESVEKADLQNIS